MKNFIAAFSIVLGIALFTTPPDLLAQDHTPSTELSIQPVNQLDQATGEAPHLAPETEVTEDHAKPPFWLVIPFVVLLLMIATGPLFYEDFWHRNYPKIAVALAVVVVLYYLFVLN